jgi:tRNA(adenine34) deaminase
MLGTPIATFGQQDHLAFDATTERVARGQDSLRSVEMALPMEEVMAEKKMWVRDVNTVSTYPPKDLFTKDAETIARAMASKKVSPKGIGSGIRMIQFFINRAGKGLSAARKRELEKAKHILQAKLKKKAKDDGD